MFNNILKAIICILLFMFIVPLVIIGTGVVVGILLKLIVFGMSVVS